MGGHGGDFYIDKYATSEATANRPEYHGAREVIRKDSHAIRVYPDGVRVGCSWVTPEALRAVIEAVKERNPQMLRKRG